jgi:two-component system, NarL family, nitrate/nitrite sensor histidine kinase NarX
MPQLKRFFFHSVMNYINLSLFTIVGIALISIFFSFWITDKTDNDANAINLSGTMRMQTFQIGMALNDSPSDVPTLVELLDKTWSDPLFTHIIRNDDQDALHAIFQSGYMQWFEVVKPAIENDLSQQKHNPDLYALLGAQVLITDALVDELQANAESKIKNLRSLQLFSLLITTVVGSFVFYLLKNRVEAPLTNLTEVAAEMSKGNIKQHIHATGSDELAILGQTFNQLSRSISETYEELETRVADRTKELQQNNTSLSFLFNIAREVLENNKQELDYNAHIKTLAQILDEGSIELCLFTHQGELPYLSIDSSDPKHKCLTKACADCKGIAPFDTVQALGVSHRYPIIEGQKQYGVVQVRSSEHKPLEAWQDTLLRSTADQFAIALSLSETKNQEHRLAMLNERTVIARELHDSLAQSLSYLQIQVTRLKKAQEKSAFELQEPIIEELREGLSSAYRQLRELLTTFRLKIDHDGLQGTIEQIASLLRQQTDMEIALSYELNDLPLRAIEEIHLMQITREASQNAINHSKGENLAIRLFQHQDKSIELSIEDDGVGIHDSPEKLNHYGLNIMQERSRDLNGRICIENRSEKGTRVAMRFMPMYLKDAS